MWKKYEILHIWHVFDVENVAIYAKFMPFSWKNQFCENLCTLSQNPFCCNLRTFVWRKIYTTNFFVEKMTNLRSGTRFPHLGPPFCVRHLSLSFPNHDLSPGSTRSARSLQSTGPMSWLHARIKMWHKIWSRVISPRSLSLANVNILVTVSENLNSFFLWSKQKSWWSKSSGCLLWNSWRTNSSPARTVVTADIASLRERCEKKNTKKTNKC